MNSSTHSSTLSALSVNHSHQEWETLEADGGALEVRLGFGWVCESHDVVSSNPEARVAKLDNEGRKLVVAMKVIFGTGSTGVSFGGASGSVCKPTGFRGRRRVPLLGTGSTPMESQMILYSSMFSRIASVYSAFQCHTVYAYGKVPFDYWVCEEMQDPEQQI